MHSASTTWIVSTGFVQSPIVMIVRKPVLMDVTDARRVLSTIQILMSVNKTLNVQSNTVRTALIAYQFAKVVLMVLKILVLDASIPPALTLSVYNALMVLIFAQSVQMGSGWIQTPRNASTQHAKLIIASSVIQVVHLNVIAASMAFS